MEQECHKLDKIIEQQCALNKTKQVKKNSTACERYIAKYTVHDNTDRLKEEKRHLENDPQERFVDH